MKKNSDGNTLDNTRQLLLSLRRVVIVAAVFTLIASPLFALNKTAHASQVTNRSLAISNAVQGATGVQYTFTVSPSTTGVIQSMFFEACNTPVGACVQPTGMNISGGTAALTSGFSGATGMTQSTSSATPAGTGNSTACSALQNLCLTWSSSTPYSSGSPLVVTVTNVTNQTGSPTCTNANTQNCTFFVRITTYSDTAWATPVDNGNVASSTTQPLTVQSIIQEELSFCVGTVAGDSSTIEAYNSAVPTCALMTGTTVDLGVLNYADVSVSPVPTTQPTIGNNDNAVVELSTNAYNGTTVSYTSLPQLGTNHQGAMRVSNATCAAGTSFTDQCINSAGTTATALTPGIENFGMTVPGVNCTNTPSIAGYTCNDTNHNLVVQPNYDCSVKDLTPTENASGVGSFNVTDAGGQTTGNPTTTNCSYAWDELGTDVTPVATSAAPNGVVPGEALIVEFAATPEVTTPTGSYAAETSFIATPEY